MPFVIREEIKQPEKPKEIYFSPSHTKSSMYCNRKQATTQDIINKSQDDYSPFYPLNELHQVTVIESQRAQFIKAPKNEERRETLRTSYTDIERRDTVRTMNCGDDFRRDTIFTARTHSEKQVTNAQTYIK